MVGLDDPSATVHQSSAGWVPVYVDQGRRLGVMSIGFLLKDRGDSVVWRGPKKDGMIRQFLSEVRWGDLDYLVIDTPPGKYLYHSYYWADEQKGSVELMTSRYIRRTHIPLDPPPPPLHPHLPTPYHPLLHPHHHPANYRSKRYPQIPLLHPQTRLTRTGSRREYGGVCMPLLW